MKKLVLMLTLALFSFGILVPQIAFAGAVTTESIEYGVTPGKGQDQKEVKKKLRFAAKKYKAEIKGMTKAEKEAFLMDKIEKEDLQVPRKQLLIVALILLLVGWVLSALFWRSWGFAWILGFVGTVLLIVWAVLWLLDEI